MSNKDLLMEEDFSRLTARDLLLKNNERLKVLEKEQDASNRRFEKFCDNEYKKLYDDVSSLQRFRAENVGVWKTVTGISVLLGILATLIALFK